jgi:hypothetical protein
MDLECVARVTVVNVSYQRLLALLVQYFLPPFRVSVVVFHTHARSRVIALPDEVLRF